jgi:hypothetical protein
MVNYIYGEVIDFLSGLPAEGTISHTGVLSSISHTVYCPLAGRGLESRGRASLEEGGNVTGICHGHVLAVPAIYNRIVN